MLYWRFCAVAATWLITDIKISKRKRKRKQIKPMVFKMVDQIQDLLLLSHSQGLLNYKEYFFCYMNFKRLKAWKYERFDINNMETVECNYWGWLNIFVSKDVLQITDQIIWFNGTSISSIEVIRISLKRYSYPFRYLGMIGRFWCSVPELCIISNQILNLIFDR